MKLCRHEVRAARGEGGAKVRILSFPLQCNRGGGPAFWASRCGRASARILGLAVWFGAHSAPASCLRAVGAGVLALILGVRRHLRRVVTIT